MTRETLIYHVSRWESKALWGHLYWRKEHL